MKPNVVICIVILTIITWCGLALSEIENTNVFVNHLAKCIQILQPRVSDERANMLAQIFAEAGENTNIDPKLLIAISFRESSFNIEFEKNKRFGKNNEVGLMQCHGTALRFRPEECSHDIPGARCQILTGSNYLAYNIEYCGGSIWVGLAAYKYGRCVSETRAIKSNSIKNAKRYYKKIGGIVD